MAAPAIRTGVTPDEYLAFERTSEERHEYADGEVFAMSGGTREHSLLSAHVVRDLGAQLRRGPCEVHTSDLKIGIPSRRRYVYPDVSVVCGAPVFEDAERDVVRNPKVVVEVLSDSSEAYDRGDKFAQYRAVASLTDYLLVSQKEPRVEHFVRQEDGKWLLAIATAGVSIPIDSIGATLSVDDLYERVLDEDGA
jgi:Uma2 family endonuclease